MRRIRILTAFLLVFGVSFCWIGAVSAQSLSELAAKEKKRRQVNRSEGRNAKTLELEASNSVSTKTSETTSDDGEKDPEEAERLDDDVAAIRGYAPERGSNDGWDTIYAGYLKRYRDVSNELDQLRVENDTVCSKLEPAGTGNAVPTNSENSQVVVVPTAQQNRCSTIPATIARLQIERKQIEADCAEDARRRGVLPGRARLSR